MSESNIIAAEEMQLATHAYQQEQRVKELKGQLVKNYIELGQIFKDVRDNELYKQLGYDTLGEWFASPDIAMTPAWAWHAIQSYEVFILEHNRSMDEIATIDYTKLVSILPVVKKQPEQLDRWLTAAKELRRIDLQKELKEQRLTDRITTLSHAQPLAPMTGLYHAPTLEGLVNVSDNSVDLVLSAPPTDLLAFEYTDFLAAMRRVLKPTGSLMFFCDYHTLFPLVTALQVNDYRLIRDIVVTYDVAKKNLGVTNLLPAHDLVLWAAREGKADYNLTEVERDVWLTSFKETEYPYEKPMLLLEKLIQLATLPQAVVLDPFAGSGNTLLAAKRTNRIPIGIEKNDLWYQTSLAKLQ